MADRYPLVVDSSNQNIKELPDGDSLLLGDSEKLRLGDGQDLNLYHDGSNSYLANSTGALKLATETSGIAVTIGHTTSETTVADNLTITGNTATTGTSTFTGVATASTSSNITQTALTSSSNAVAWDAAAKANAYHVTTENTTFSAPSNAVEGAIISVEIAQGGTARTVAWNTVFEFAASTAPVVTATANKTDIFAFRYNGSVWQEIGRVQNMAQT
tara:strand:- start:681 stop:1328 length:648 start_codon:yes stop_codon:yes gene_type:complete